MPASSGFGHSRFGHGPFGEADWAHNVFWLGMPAVYRDEDASGHLEGFMRSAGRVADDARHAARRLPYLRSPFAVRTRYQDNVTLTILGQTVVAAESTPDGRARLVLLVGEQHVGKVAARWVAESPERQYDVLSKSIVNGTITLSADEVVPYGELLFRPLSQIEYLGADFGLDVDPYEPEGFQRGLVAEAAQWFNLKGTRQGIELRASLAGFSATVRPMYRVADPWPALLPPERLFELADGVFYTDVAPGTTVFDAIPADVIPMDRMCTLDALAGTPIEFDITVSAVSTSGGVHTLTIDEPLAMLTNEGTDRWRIVPDADPTLEFWLESADTVLGQMVVAGSVVPDVGSYKLVYACLEGNMCSWCRSHLVAIDCRVVSQQLLSNARALNAALQRFIAKVLAILPLHVRPVFTLVTEGGAAVDVSSAGDSSTLVFGKFDEIAADVQAMDDIVETIPA